MAWRGCGKERVWLEEGLADGGGSQRTRAGLSVQILHSTRVLVQLVVFKFNKVVKKAWPGLSVVILSQICPHDSREVKKHIPGIPGNSSDLRMFFQEVKPLFK